MIYSTHKVCSICNRNLLLELFPPYYRLYEIFGKSFLYSYMRECWDCRFDIELDILYNKVKNDSYDYNNYTSLKATSVTQALTHGILKLADKCSFCDNPAEEFHHPKPRRPLDGYWLCCKCHDKVNNDNQFFYKKIGVYPEYYLREVRKHLETHEPSFATLNSKNKNERSWGYGSEPWEYFLSQNLETTDSGIILMAPKPPYTPVPEDKRRKEYRDAHKGTSTIYTGLQI